MTATDATFYGRRKHLNPVFWQMSFSKTRDRSIDNWLTSDESSKPAFTVLVLTLLWFLVCMAYFIFNFDILSWPYLERYGIWIVLALALVGAICSFLGLAWLRKKPFSAIAIMVLVAIVFAGHFSSYGYTLGAKIRFAMAFRHYENELDRILGPNRDTLPTPSDDYLIDRGPPIRMPVRADRLGVFRRYGFGGRDPSHLSDRGLSG